MFNKINTNSFIFVFMNNTFTLTEWIVNADSVSTYAYIAVQGDFTSEHGIVDVNVNITFFIYKSLNLIIIPKCF